MFNHLIFPFLHLLLQISLSVVVKSPNGDCLLKEQALERERQPCLWCIYAFQHSTRGGLRQTILSRKQTNTYGVVSTCHRTGSVMRLRLQHCPIKRPTAYAVVCSTSLLCLYLNGEKIPGGDCLLKGQALERERQPCLWCIYALQPSTRVGLRQTILSRKQTNTYGVVYFCLRFDSVVRLRLQHCPIKRPTAYAVELCKTVCSTYLYPKKILFAEKLFCTIFISSLCSFLQPLLFIRLIFLLSTSYSIKHTNFAQQWGLVFNFSKPSG